MGSQQVCHWASSPNSCWQSGPTSFLLSNPSASLEHPSCTAQDSELLQLLTPLPFPPDFPCPSLLFLGSCNVCWGEKLALTNWVFIQILSLMPAFLCSCVLLSHSFLDQWRSPTGKKDRTEEIQWKEWEQLMSITPAPQMHTLMIILCNLHKNIWEV